MFVYFKKNILVLGAGLSGIGVAKVLADKGAYVTLSDIKESLLLKSYLKELKNKNVQILIGQQTEKLLNNKQVVVLSPGISIYMPLIAKAINKNISIISELEIACMFAKAPIIAITGTNGKTTVTSILGIIMKQAGLYTIIGGNIGINLTEEIVNNPKADVIVAEISSYQLEATNIFKANISVILNITPDHQERHRSLKEYIDIKKKIFSNQMPNHICILNYDDEKIRKMGKYFKGKIIWFSRKRKIRNSVYKKGNKIYIAIGAVEIEFMNVKELKILGEHNIENALAAIAVSYIFGVNINVIKKTLQKFAGVEHRIEFVRELNGVKYYNDSKATNPESTIKALQSFDKNIILIAGGREKNTDLTEMMLEIRKHVSYLILIGEAKGKFVSEARKCGIANIYCATNLRQATEKAKEFSSRNTVVLLSPACASYDMYDNFEQRGEEFKSIVNEFN